jgi:hypothetical protein
MKILALLKLGFPWSQIKAYIPAGIPKDRKTHFLHVMYFCVAYACSPVINVVNELINIINVGAVNIHLKLASKIVLSLCKCGCVSEGSKFSFVAMLAFG